MVINIRDIKDFKKIADSVKPDDRKRVGLHKVKIQEGVSYHIYANSTGQILLDPQVTIPASELWVFKNEDVLAAIDQSMEESAKGQLIDRGSFAEYVKNES
jgi:hypothetical protein